MKKSLLPGFLLLSALPLHAALTAGSLFGDHAVLQQGVPVPVWGTASPGQEVAVSYDGKTAQAAADGEGRWRATLPALETGKSGELEIRSGTESLRFTDVVTGEVWLCSGQSNMAFMVKQANGAQEAAAAANDPLLREFKVAYVLSEKPLDTVKGKWIPCTPQTVGDYTAAGYYFARDLRKALNVPVGLINSSKGGSPIEAWLSPEALDSEPKFSAIRSRWAQAMADYPRLKEAYEKDLAAWQIKADDAQVDAQPVPPHKPAPPFGPGDFHTPTGLHGGMLNGLVPYAIRGVLWYQGEENVNRADEYAPLLTALIADWRKRWEREDLPFFVVQLPNISDAMSGDHTPGHVGWPYLREAQAQVPSTGLAVTIDVGDPKNRHPKDKEPVGHRLALLARARVYGEAVADSGPVFESWKADGASARVRFTHAEGLSGRSDAAPGGFEIAGSNGGYKPAAARIEGDEAVLTSPEVLSPAFVRYAWHDDPADANLVNQAGLPAAPFRTDTAPFPTPKK